MKEGVMFIFILHMKYIISEQQNERIKMKFFHLFDVMLTPVGGWKEKQWYRQFINSPDFDHEMFLPLEQKPNMVNVEFGNFDPEETEHIYYTSCRNPNYSFSEGECPVVILPNSKYNLFNDLSGEEWIELFKEWFEENTGLPVVRVL